MNDKNEIVYKTPANLPAVGRLSLAGEIDLLIRIIYLLIQSEKFLSCRLQPVPYNRPLFP